MPTITQQEIDRMWLEAELDVDALFDEVYEEMLGNRAPLLARMQEIEQAKAQIGFEAETFTEGV